MIEKLTDTIVVLAAFLAALGCYTALLLVGVTDIARLQDVVIGLSTGLLGLAVGAHNQAK